MRSQRYSSGGGRPRAHSAGDILEAPQIPLLSSPQHHTGQNLHIFGDGSTNNGMHNNQQRVNNSFTNSHNFSPNSSNSHILNNNNHSSNSNHSNHNNNNGGNNNQKGPTKDTWISPFENSEQNLEYFMFIYKCLICELRRNCPNKVTCKGWHHEGERRRNPKHFTYSEEPCPNVKGSGNSKWLTPSRCPHGDGCQYSHTLLEQMYHPYIYKTSGCINFSHPNGNRCQWGYYCTHSHGRDDIRNPPRRHDRRRAVSDSATNNGQQQPMSPERSRFPTNSQRNEPHRTPQNGVMDRNVNTWSARVKTLPPKSRAPAPPSGQAPHPPAPRSTASETTPRRTQDQPANIPLLPSQTMEYTRKGSGGKLNANSPPYEMGTQLIPRVRDRSVSDPDRGNLLPEHTIPKPRQIVQPQVDDSMWSHKRPPSGGDVTIEDEVKTSSVTITQPLVFDEFGSGRRRAHSDPSRLSSSRSSPSLKNHFVQVNTAQRGDSPSKPQQSFETVGILKNLFGFSEHQIGRTEMQRQQYLRLSGVTPPTQPAPRPRPPVSNLPSGEEFDRLICELEDQRYQNSVLHQRNMWLQNMIAQVNQQKNDAVRRAHDSSAKHTSTQEDDREERRNRRDQVTQLVTCPVCKSCENPRNTAIIPCGHLVCGGCASNNSSRSSCPVCNAPIKLQQEVRL